MLTVGIDRGLVGLLQRFSRVAAALSALIAGGTLLGWILGAEVLKSGLPNLPTMKANAALANLLVAVALLLWQRDDRRIWLRLSSRLVAALAAVVSLMTFLQYVLGVNLGIDQLLFEEPPGMLGTFSPNRMAPNLALAFLSAAVAVMLLSSRTRGGLIAAQALAAFAGLIGLLALVGYAYGVQAFIAIGPYTSVALPAGVSLLLLAAAILHERPDQGLMVPVTSQGYGGVLTRRLLPMVLLAPLFLGFLVLRGYRAALYDQAFGMSLLAVSSVVLFALLVWATAAYMDRIDAERRRAREALSRSESLFRAAMEGSLDAFYMLGSVRDEGGAIQDFRFLDLNARGAQLIGMDRDEIIGEKLCELVPVNRTGGFFDRYIQVVETRKPLVEEFQNSDGRIQASWLYHQVIPLGDGIAITSRDITRRKEAEQERARLSRHLELLLASTDEGLYGIDNEGNCTFVNRAACQMLGYRQEEVIGKNMHDLIHHQHLDGTPYDVRDCPIYLAFHSGSGVRLDTEVFWRRDGTPFPVDYSSYPVIEDDTIRGSVVTFSDITTRKRAEEEIRALNRGLVERANDLVAMNRELEAFSYSVSHDLRAPLRSIDGFSQALLEDYSDRLDDGGKDYLQRVRAASQRMGQLIDDMLNLSRVTRSELTRETIDLSAMAEAVIEDLRARSPGRRAEWYVEPGLSANADPRLMRIVIQNLLENAWKFSANQPHPRIEVGATEREGKRACFVRDNGAGFDMAYVGKLFGAFQRLHAHNEYSGTGIGLATVQRIVHRHGGQVWAEGKLDEGAVFYFTLE